MIKESDISNETLFREILTQLQTAGELLNKSNASKLIPGKHIRMTETEQGILIEAETQDLPDALKRWIIDADRIIQRPPPIIGENGINAEWDGSSWHLSLSSLPQPPAAQVSGGIQDAKNASPALPFQVTCHGYINGSSAGDAGWLIQVYGWNPDEGRYFKNLVFVGVQEPMEIAESTLLIPSGGWIYVQIQYDSSNGAYTAGLKYASSFPETGAGSYQVPLAQIVISDQGEVHVGQLHTGNIFAAGRIL